ncbi:MAG: transposase [Deltaproteobacteria bacterium]|nr:transposase [Deltaproteobacteria bacterium]
MNNLKTRKQIRLPNYDYSKDGFYFITICSKDRENIFGDIPVGAAGWPPDDRIDIQLNDFGRIVEEELKKSQIIRDEIIIDQYAIMPNHIHCIIGITDGNNAGGQPAAPTKGTLSSFVNGFKSAVTTRINTLRNMPGEPVWQRSFYDHVIRNERSLNAIREYILANPVNWELDIENILNL